MNAARALNVVVTGGSGASGVATARALLRSGHTVFTVGSNRARIEAAAAEAGSGVTPLVCDLAALADVRALRTALHALLPPVSAGVDGVIHLVGGWRGGKGIAEQSDEDWEFLERNAIRTLRNVARVFYDDLAASPAGRFAMVSSTAAGKPTAANANYAAAKAAAEAWTLAMADGFGRSGSGSAAVVFVVKALVDAGMRAASPDRTFPGFTDVEDLAAAAAGLFSAPAAGLNGRRLLLSPGPGPAA